MTKQDYLSALRAYLAKLPSDEVEDILRDFEEHFSIGLSQDKTEQEIAAELGSPAEVAKTYIDETIPEGFEATTAGARVTGQTIAAAPVAKAEKDVSGARVFVVLFNLLVFIWVWISIAMTVLGFWMLPVGLIIAVIAMLIAIAAVPAAAMAFYIFLLLGLLFLAIATGIAMFFATKGFIWVTVEYVKWNKKIYKEGF